MQHSLLSCIICAQKRRHFDVTFWSFSRGHEMDKERLGINTKSNMAVDITSFRTCNICRLVTDFYGAEML